MDIKIDNSTAVIFDLDDTLYNEISYLKSAYREIATLLDPSGNERLYSHMFSLYRNKKDVFEFLSKNFRIDKNGLIKLYREHLPEIEPFESVLALLKSIKSKLGMTGIITDGRELTQMNKIKALGIDSFIDNVVISEVLGTEKPNQENYVIMADSLNAKTYFYVGDNLKKDFITPNAMGWSTIGVIDNGLNIHNDSFKYMKGKYMPHYFVNSIMDIRIGE